MEVAEEEGDLVEDDLEHVAEGFLTEGRRHLLQQLRVVEHEIDPMAIDGSGRTPLDVARKAGKQSVIDFLETVETEKGSYTQNTMAVESASCVNACTSGDACIIS